MGVLDELERLEKAATRGDWQAYQFESLLRAEWPHDDAKSDSEIIALLRNNAKALIECARVLDHALELGYFAGQGSTDVWAREALAKLEGGE